LSRPDWRTPKASWQWGKLSVVSGPLSVVESDLVEIPNRGRIAIALGDDCRIDVVQSPRLRRSPQLPHQFRAVVEGLTGDELFEDLVAIVRDIENASSADAPRNRGKRLPVDYTQFRNRQEAAPTRKCAQFRHPRTHIDPHAAGSVACRGLSNSLVKFPRIACLMIGVPFPPIFLHEFAGSERGFEGLEHTGGFPPHIVRQAAIDKSPDVCSQMILNSDLDRNRIALPMR